MRHINRQCSRLKNRVDFMHGGSHRQQPASRTHVRHHRVGSMTSQFNGLRQRRHVGSQRCSELTKAVPQYRVGTQTFCFQRCSQCCRNSQNPCLCPPHIFTGLDGRIAKRCAESGQVARRVQVIHLRHCLPCNIADGQDGRAFRIMRSLAGKQPRDSGAGVLRLPQNDSFTIQQSSEFTGFCGFHCSRQSLLQLLGG